MIAILLAAAAASATPQAEWSPLDPVAIVGADLFPVDGPEIKNGTILFRDGKIVAIGEKVELPPRVRRIEGTGKTVTPGLIDAYTHLGLLEIDQVKQTDELSEENGEAIRAAFRAIDGVNPASAVIPVTRIEGVTSAIARPEGGLISGQSAFLRLDGRRVEEMTWLAACDLQVNLGELSHPWGGTTRGGALHRLRQAFEDARFLRAHLAAEDENRLRALSAPRLDLEALWPVIDGKMPLVVRADRASDIEAALRFGREERVKIVLEGAGEGWRVADEIAREKVPVLLDEWENLPGSFDTLGARYDNAALLDSAGVTVAIVTGEAHRVRELRQRTGVAISFGLPWAKGLAAVTRVPAEIFGLGDRTGSLTRGRSADLVVWSGEHGPGGSPDPFELSTQPEEVFIAGKEIPLRSRQTELLERYRTLPPRR